MSHPAHVLLASPSQRMSSPRLIRAIERRFRQMEVSVLNLVVELGITDPAARRQAMEAATQMVAGLRRELATAAPGRLER